MTLRQVLAPFRALWQLHMYVLIAFPFLILMLPTLPLLLAGSKVAVVLWIWFDRFVCTLAHFTWKRTISGYTGERMEKYPRYRLQGKVIDKLAQWCGDEKEHCLRAYMWEKEEGFVDAD